MNVATHSAPEPPVAAPEVPALPIPGVGDPAQSRAPLAGKYMTFRLAEEDYGLEIVKVREIIGLQPIHRVPRTPDLLRGIINLRGSMIPVVDLRRHFGMPSAEATRQHVIIVVQCAVQGRSLTCGLLVDEVQEVLSIDEASIEAAPSLDTSIDTSFILGVGKIRERVVFLLDIARVLGDGRILAVA